MKHFLLGLLILAVISCSYKPITGEIKAVHGDTVEISKYKFKVLKNVPKVGQKCTFTPTRDSSLVNCIKI